MAISFVAATGSIPVPAFIGDVMDSVLPLYTIKCYGDDLYSVSHRLYTPSLLKIPREAYGTYDNKLSASLSRARAAVREYALCNKWEYFVTFTLDGARWERYGDLAMQHFLTDLLQWLQNLRKTTCPRLRYLLVPDFHEDGAIHFHGLFSGVVGLAPFPPWVPRRLLDGGYLNWPVFQQRYGFCSFGAVRDPVAVGFYIRKYITRSLSSACIAKGVHSYYHSRGLLRALPVGYLYRGCRMLDNICRSSNVFFSTGFFRSDSVGAVVDLCDEVTDLYKSHLLFDDDSVDGGFVPVAILGGDDHDDYLQLVLSEFSSSDYFVYPFNSLDLSPGSGG